MSYNMLPSYSIAQGQLESGYRSLAQRLTADSRRVWLIDGMSCIDWAAFRQGLETSLGESDAVFLDVTPARLSTRTVKRLLSDWLDNDDPFGKPYPGSLSDFFNRSALDALGEQAREANERGRLVICYGQGSALLALEGGRAWVELSKELIHRRAANGDTGLLAAPPYSPERSITCVDWPVMQRHKSTLLPTLDLCCDSGQPESPVWIDGPALRATISTLARQPFRTRPLFSARVWGGQWLKRYIPLDPEMPNCAWSLDLIGSENGVLLEDDGLRFEMPFELLLAQEPENLQGPHLAQHFGADFPLRFNLTDTIGGGDLSCQVHPTPEYALRQLGYPFIENETYYVLRAEGDALIFLGLNEKADDKAFRRAAERARNNGFAFDVEEFVDAWPSRAHALFHVPAGTVHNIGKNNLVLEIITSSLVHTYRIYDYLRPDATGAQRAVQIEHAWNTTDFGRRTRWVREHLIPTTIPVRRGEGWMEHVFDGPPFLHHTVHRAEFSDTYPDDTRGECFHMLHVVEGDTLAVDWQNGSHPLHYAETILIPAATGEYRLRRQSPGLCKVVKATVRCPT